MKADAKKECRHHEPGKPDGYVDRSYWFEKMAKTHTQEKCPGCGLWAVWVRKPRAAREAKP